MKNDIKVSIIIASLNAVKRIENAILSVLNQDYNNIEIVVIDGGSTDGTLDIIKKYQDRIKYWVSKKDKGISDAFNKGVNASSGDYINFQGADDYLLKNDVISLMMKDINKDKDMLVCGRIERIKESEEKVISWVSKEKFTGRKSLLFRMSLPHQALFTNKKFFEEYGNFDLSVKFSMDYELLLRAYKNFPEVIMKNVFVSAWREGGIGGNRNLKIYKEYFEIKKKNKVAPVYILYLVYLWSVFKYYVRNFLVFLNLYKN